MLKRSAIAVSLAIVIGAPGCEQGPADDGAAEADPTVTVRDSAGIEIVENNAPQHAAGEFWTFDTVPEIVLGGANTLGEPVHDSAQLVWDVVGLARLEDGRVAILSSQGTQLLLFEPSGNLSRIIGRSGEGPGEFTRPEWLQYFPPDTLVVWDYFMTSIDHFDTTGVLVGERRGDHARLLELGLYGENFGFPIADGAFMAFMKGREVDPELPWSDCSPREFWTSRVNSEGQPISQGELSEWVPEEYVMIDSTFSAHSFGCPSQVAFGGQSPSIYIPARRSTGIYRFDLDGSLSRIIRRSTEVEPIVLNTRGSPEGAGAVVADTLSPFFDVVVDTEGYLWARSSSPETGLGDHWSVFSPEGRWLGVMPVPWGGGASGLCRGQGYTSACWVDRDFFMILRRDEFGVERVEGYRMRRGG